MTVAFLDVGQGDAAVVSFPDGSHWLIDSGNKWEGGDTGKFHIIPYLRWAGITKLNGIILSHPDLDHVGGAASVISSVRVDTVYEALSADGNTGSELLFSAMRNHKTGHSNKYMGDTIGRGKNWRIYVLSPKQLRGDSIDYIRSNENSMVILAVYGKTRFLFTGDIQRETENSLVESYGNFLDADVLKVAHHGSKNSSSEQFLRAVMPEYAVISAGKNNIYHHPSQETLSGLDSVNAKVYITFRQGAVLLYSDGKKVYRQD